MTASSAKNAVNNTANIAADNEPAVQAAAFTAAPTNQTGKEATKASPIPHGAGFSIMGDSISTLGGFIPPRWRCHYEGEVSCLSWLKLCVYCACSARHGSAWLPVR